MAYYTDIHNTTFFPTSSVRDELNVDSYPSEAPATEEAGPQDSSIFADRWSTVERPGSVVGSPASIRTTSSCESVASVTSYDAWSDDGQMSHHGHHWSTVDERPQYHNSGFSSQDGHFDRMAAPERSSVVPVPSSTPLNYWGANQSGPSTSMYHTDNMHVPYRPRTGPARTELVQTGRFQPYGMSRTRRNEYRNAEAGPSTLMVPPAPYVSPPTSRPSGGRSETTADAEHQNSTEEDEAPRQKQKRARLPRGEGQERPYRGRMQGNAHELCDWVRRRNKLPKAPSLSEALKVVVGLVSRVRSPVYDEPQLHTKPSGRTVKGSKLADAEFERRTVERERLQELSKYYRVPQGCKSGLWGRPKLLLRVMEDLPLLPKPS